ncbi:uncharacterized protein LOC106012490 [Aplysia californica]|uniref:Uncharacterized protein LOC106012490 n=1 Tax=Aplysia californica TaxID=6500 RepID=A0ABM1A565_APLCA|nr:uncharacterized protein LOC106012490 [Aplysia californica]
MQTIKAVQFRLFGKKIVIQFPCLSPSLSSDGWDEYLDSPEPSGQQQTWLPNCVVSLLQDSLVSAFQPIFRPPVLKRERTIVLERREEEEDEEMGAVDMSCNNNNPCDDVTDRAGRFKVVASTDEACVDSQYHVTYKRYLEADTMF